MGMNTPRYLEGNLKAAPSTEKERQQAADFMREAHSEETKEAVREQNKLGAARRKRKS